MKNLCVDTGEEVLCAGGPLWGGDPLCREEALCVDGRPSVWVGGPFCGEETLRIHG